MNNSFLINFNYSNHKEKIKIDSKINDASKVLRKDGFVVLDKIIDPNLIENLNNNFNDKYSDEYVKNHSLEVGDKRYLHSVKVEEAFLNKLIYANPIVIDIVYKSLGKKAIIENLGIVQAQPGAKAQHVHRDGEFLFDDYSTDGQGSLSGIIPAHALSVVFPLKKTKNKIGNTSFFPGTHRFKRWHEINPIAPVVNQGSCVIWDYRLAHAGNANKTQSNRNILIITYSRSWWKDHRNYQKYKQKKINIDAKNISKIPKEFKNLFRFV